MGLINYIAKLFRKATGEMRISGNSTGTYKLDSSRVDYSLARELYQNKNQSYKLGAAFIKPIINSTVGFMGVPHFQIEDEEANATLEEFALDNIIAIILNKPILVSNVGINKLIFKQENIFYNSDELKEKMKSNIEENKDFEKYYDIELNEREEILKSESI